MRQRMMAVRLCCCFIFIFCCLLQDQVDAVPPIEFGWDHYLKNPEFEKPFQNLKKVPSILHFLPENLYPEHYDLEVQPLLDVSPYGNLFTCPGKIKILVTCYTPTTNISLNSITVNITQASVKVTNVGTGQNVPVVSHIFEEHFEFYTIGLGSELNANEKYEVYIEFESRISRTRLNGLYLSNYTTDANETRFLAVTKFEPPDARRAWPCFDEPAYKATWTIRIIRMTKYHSLSNMARERTSPISEKPGWEMDFYPESVKMSSYLVCLLVSDFESEISSPIYHEKRVTVWGPPPLMAKGAGKFAPNYSAQVMGYLETYFGMNYTMTKMDKISIPHFASGAMENWGLNSYRETRLMYLEETSLFSDKVAMTTTISHEFAHEWFGNIVTMKWWCAIWLNEGFATYVASIGVQKFFPEYLPLEVLTFNMVQVAFQSDVLNSTHPVHNELVQTTDEIRAMFNSIIYSKGGSILRMTSAFLTEETFTKGVKAYLQKYKFSNTYQDDLFEELQLAAVEDKSFLPPEGDTVKDVLGTWTLLSGFPLVRVNRSFETGEISLTQEKFFITEAGPSESRWYIPIAYDIEGESQLNKTTKVWMTPNDVDDTIALPGNFDPEKWIIFNPAHIGFYRVLYDIQTLEMLTSQLKTDHEAIAPTSRSSLLDDSLNIAFSGKKYLPLSYALQLSVYLEKERHYVPWVSYLTNMATSYRLIARTSTFADYRKYMLNLITPALDAIDYDLQEGDIDQPTNTILLRTRLMDWVCKLDGPKCVTESKTKMSEWMANPNKTSIIFPDLQSILYCTAVANGDSSVEDFLLEQYVKTSREPMQINILKSLACSKSTTKLARLLSKAIDPLSEIRDTQRQTLLTALASNTQGTDLTFTFLRNNFELIIRRFGVKLFATTIQALGQHLVTSSDAKDLETFMAKYLIYLAPELPLLKQALENIRENKAWIDTHLLVFKDFLSSTYDFD